MPIPERQELSNAILVDRKDTFRKIRLNTLKTLIEAHQSHWVAAKGAKKPTPFICANLQKHIPEKVSGRICARNGFTKHESRGDDRNRNAGRSKDFCVF